MLQLRRSIGSQTGLFQDLARHRTVGARCVLALAIRCATGMMRGSFPYAGERYHVRSWALQEAFALADLYIPIQGQLVDGDCGPETPYGHRLHSPLWRGAEIGFLGSDDAARRAVAETVRRGLRFGVHFPLVQRHAWHWAPQWLADGGAARAEAKAEAALALRQAADLGASYVLFHYPWPAVLEAGVDYRAAGWRIPPHAQPAAIWPRARLAEVSEEVFSSIAGAASRSGLRAILELDGPNAAFFPPPGQDDLVTQLFGAYPELSLCLDTGRLDLLARQHGGDAKEYARRWLPFTKHLHLHGARWRLRENHLPPMPEHEDANHYAPVTAIARTVLRAHPQAPVVLETNPASLPPEERERSMRYCAAL